MDNTDSREQKQQTQAEEIDNKKNTSEEPKEKAESWKDWFRFTKEDLKTILVTMVAAVFLVVFVAQPVIVDGESMNDTLYSGERLLIEKVTRYYGGLERFDIVVFDPENESGALYIKRIIGLPGETVRIEDGVIYINGEVLEEDYGREVILDAGRAWETITLGEDEYFVMGDNRNDSLDSRFEEVGNVNLSQITGRVIIQMFPFHKVD